MKKKHDLHKVGMAALESLVEAGEIESDCDGFCYEIPVNIDDDVPEDDLARFRLAPNPIGALCNYLTDEMEKLWNAHYRNMMLEEYLGAVKLLYPDLAQKDGSFMDAVFDPLVKVFNSELYYGYDLYHESSLYRKVEKNYRGERHGY